MTYKVEGEIENDVPIPEGRQKGRWQAKFADMKIGDSIFFPDTTPHTIQGRTSGTARQTGWRFTIRSVPGGTRVWRVT